MLERRVSRSRTDSLPQLSSVPEFCFIPYFLAASLSNGIREIFLQHLTEMAHASSSSTILLSTEFPFLSILCYPSPLLPPICLYPLLQYHHHQHSFYQNLPSHLLPPPPTPPPFPPSLRILKNILLFFCKLLTYLYTYLRYVPTCILVYMSVCMHVVSNTFK